MKTKLFIILFVLISAFNATSQKACNTYQYNQKNLSLAGFKENVRAIEDFTQEYISSNRNIELRGGATLITIPVVVHVLYHLPEENISEVIINQQFEVINECFRRRNSDSVNTPARFKSVAADCEIEFKLAISDPRRRNTNGIVRKYTPISLWQDDDKMKFSAQMGDDAWDTRSYLNIWVCNLERVAGYSSLPGTDTAKDGIVMSFGAFGTGGMIPGFDKGKTLVHEIGHWLNLKHIWGDEYCGDDGVSDTPKQAYANSGCPSGIITTCGNAPNGDMYMNYMDFTDDACTNMFTVGQASRMRSLFAQGGARNSLLSSTGLSMPLIFEIPVPEPDPRWLHPQLFPNPATTQATIDLSYDPRWLGKTLTIVNMNGLVLKQVMINNKIQQIKIDDLKPGMYIIYGKKGDGESLKQKFVKL